MNRVATFECWCCGGRVVRRLQPRERCPSRLACQGWCPSCGGGCQGHADRVVTETLRVPAEILVQAT